MSSCSSSSPKRPVRTLGGVGGGTELGGVSTGGIDYVLRRLRELKVAQKPVIDQEANPACTVRFIFSSLGGGMGLGSAAFAP